MFVHLPIYLSGIGRHDFDGRAAFAAEFAGKSASVDTTGNFFAGAPDSPASVSSASQFSPQAVAKPVRNQLTSADLIQFTALAPHELCHA
jgi:hypothetical protein